RMELLGAIELAAHDDALGEARRDAACQKSVSTHAGEEVEKDLRQAEFGAALGDDDIGRQRRLETAAEGIALYQRHRDDRQIEAEAGRVCVAELAAGMCVAAQRRAVAVADELREKLEIAAEVPHPRLA